MKFYCFFMFWKYSMFIPKYRNWRWF